MLAFGLEEGSLHVARIDAQVTGLQRRQRLLGRTVRTRPPRWRRAWTAGEPTWQPCCAGALAYHCAGALSNVEAVRAMVVERPATRLFNASKGVVVQAKTGSADDDPNGKFDDEDYPAYTMGRAADMLGTTAGFLRSLNEANYSRLNAPRADTAAIPATNCGSPRGLVNWSITAPR